MEENTPPQPPQYAPPPASPPPPPPLPPPPRIVAPQSAPYPRRGRGWMVLALILLAFLGISMLFNFSSFMSRFGRGTNARYIHSVGPKLEEVLVEDHDSANKVAIIDVHGIITSQVIDQGGFSLVDVIKAELKRAEDDDRVRAVILKVDSPGGEVLASDEINRAIADFQKTSSKAVIASMGDLAASGGYYIAAPCRWIVANELTITGSIGVIMHNWNYRRLMDKVGLVPQVYKSGKFKDMLSGDRELDEITPQEREMLQSMIDQTYRRFKTVVAEGREQARKKNKDEGRALSDEWTNYADGRVLTGTDAYKYGFVDELGNFEDAVKRAKTIAGISNANIVQYQQRYDLSDFLRLLGKSDARTTIKVDLGMEAPKLQAGKLYFLAPTFLR